MPFINIEIKARCTAVAQQRIRRFLEHQQADYRGADHQLDTYFKVPNGRLKLRQGKLENHLIHYERQNQAGPKQSDVTLYESHPNGAEDLKTILTASLGVLTVVDKTRHIYFIENVKFHLDEVRGLGYFAEIEAIDRDGSHGRERLLRQCREYIKALQIEEDHLVSESYSDLLIAAAG